MHVAGLVRIDPPRGVNRRPFRGILVLSLDKPKNDTSYKLKIMKPKGLLCRCFQISRKEPLMLHASHIRHGKASIELTNRGCTIFISDAYPDHLRRFMAVLQSVVDGDHCELSPTSTSSILRNCISMTISSRSDYPRMGFPAELQIMVLRCLLLSEFDTRWFDLSSLRSLDLGHNFLGHSVNFTTRFKLLSRLTNLTDLNLSDNDIETITDEMWLSLPKSLLVLDLSWNKLSVLSVVACESLKNLTWLNLGNNCLSSLPREISEMRMLRYLNIGMNQLSRFPCTLFKLHLEYLDASQDEINIHRPPIRSLFRIVENEGEDEVAPLSELASAVIANHRHELDLSVLPRNLRNNLFLGIRYCCVCGNYCAKTSTSTILLSVDMRSFAKAKQITMSQHRFIVDAQHEICKRRQMVIASLQGNGPSLF